MSNSMSRTLFSPRGRIARLPALLTALALATVQVTLAMVAFAVALRAGNAWLTLVPVPIWLTIGWLGSCVIIRRLHDMDRTGWHTAWIVALSAAGNVAGQAGTEALAMLLGLLSVAAALWLMLTPGTPGPNRFGPPRA